MCSGNGGDGFNNIPPFGRPSSLNLTVQIDDGMFSDCWHMELLLVPSTRDL